MKIKKVSYKQLSVCPLFFQTAFLGRDVTSAHLSSSGKVEFSTQSLKICVKGSMHTSELDLRILGGIFLCVVAFLGFKFLTSLSTASGVTF